MKKLFLLIFLLCLTATCAAAQKTVRKRPKIFAAPASENQSAPDAEQKDSLATTENYVNSSKVDSPVKILEKPRPALFPDGQDCSQGRVVLRVTFSASGEIGTITVISKLTRSKTEASIEAAKKIKFIPSIRNGKPVTVAKPVEYLFTIY